MVVGTLGCRNYLQPMEDVELVEHGVVQCADPGARDASGPLYAAPFGPSWDEQISGSRWPADPTKPQPGMGIAVEDFNDDGLDDILLPNFGPDQLYMAQPDGTYVDQTASRWPDNDDLTESAMVVDIDGDNDLDVLAGNRGGANKLYLNDGAGYFRLAIDSGLSEQPWGTVGAAFADIDLDGDVDVLFANHDPIEVQNISDPNFEPGDPNELYLNDRSGYLTEISDVLPAEYNDGYTYMAGFYDLDGDPYPDMYFTNDYGPFWKPNVALKNPGGDPYGTWVNTAPETSIDVAIGGMGMAIGDVNDDSIVDILLTNWGPILMLESADYEFWIESQAARGIDWRHPDGHYASWAADLQDLDNDGDLDFLAVCGELMEPAPRPGNPVDQPDALYLRDGDTYVEAGEEWGMHQDVGNMRGMVFVDLNKDGYLDILKRDIRGPAVGYLSRCGDSSWLMIDLIAPAPNTVAIGAKVQVTANGKTYTRWQLGGGRGFTSSSPYELHFGLGDADIVEKITVDWPNGTQSVFDNIPTRQRLDIILRH